jgi:hypothetical protein
MTFPRRLRRGITGILAKTFAASGGELNPNEINSYSFESAARSNRKSGVHLNNQARHAVPLQIDFILKANEERNFDNGGA